MGGARNRLIVLESLRRINLGLAVLLGAMLFALVATGEVAAMPGHSGQASTPHVMADAGPFDAGTLSDDLHQAETDEKTGGCPMGMMGSCCVMTCCAATMPEILPGAVRHLVIAARSSRPTVAGGLVVLPLLEPPKRLS